MTIISLQTLAQERQKFLEAHDKLIWDTFLVELKALFEKYPNVKSFSTPAYANYFNDGDPCEWGFYSDSSTMQLIGEELTEEEEEENNDNGWPNGRPYCECTEYQVENGERVIDENGRWIKTLPEKYKPLKEFVELIDIVPEHHFRAICDDGQIIFKRDGSISVDDYNHD